MKKRIIENKNIERCIYKKKFCINHVCYEFCLHDADEYRTKQIYCMYGSDVPAAIKGTKYVLKQELAPDTAYVFFVTIYEGEYILHPVHATARTKTLRNWERQIDKFHKYDYLDW